MLTVSGVFKYNFLLGEDFSTAIQPQSLRNLIVHSMTQEESQSHMRNLIANGEENEQARRLASTNQSIGLTLGKHAYYLSK